MGDDPIVISSGLVVTPESVTSRGFTTAFRGYHPAEVRQFLKRVSDEMAASAGREVELRRALQEALDRAAHPDLDEATITKALGEHAAQLIATARDNAASITREAERSADAMMHDAEVRARRIGQEAEGLLARRVAEADAATTDMQHAAGAQSHALRDQARAEAEAIVEAAKAQGKEMITEARALRERMLGDLARRRRAGQLQVEQLRAARDRLLAAYDVVRRTLDEATAEIITAEPEARMAAEAVGRRAEEHDIRAPAAGAATSTSPSAPPRPLALVVGEALPPDRDPQRLVEQETAAGADPGTPTRQAQVRAPTRVPDRPPIRPQTVADVAAGRSPAPPGAGPVPPRPTATPVARAAAPAEPGAPPSPGPAAAPVPSKVEELFSRLRAERQQGRPEPAATPTVTPAAPTPAARAEPRRPAPVPSPPPVPEVSQGIDPVHGESALEGRDDLLDNVESGLVRALKRVLQNEQNEVLDGLRRLGPSGSPLPEPTAQRATYRDAALPWLQQAARAGVGHASDPSPGSKAETAHPPIGPQAEALAAELVEPLRERLARALGETAGGEDPAVAAESLRAVYRQWKLQQVEDCARHHTVAAFSAAAFAAIPDDAPLQWLVDDDGPCPDCDDNALAGPTAKGESFPTGQRHPPAHRGCRCLLVPVTG